MKGLRLYDRLLRNYSSVNNRVTYYSTCNFREAYRPPLFLQPAEMACR
jgi:hypothetical protein